MLGLGIWAQVSLETLRGLNRALRGTWICSDDPRARILNDACRYVLSFCGFVVFIQNRMTRCDAIPKNFG